MPAVYHHDYAAFGANVLRSAWMEALMLARAERGRVFAEAIAPYYAADSDGQHYRDDFEVTSGRRGGIHNDRAYAKLSNTNSAAVIVEFGFGPGVDKNGNAYPAQEGHRVLGKALEAMR